MECKAERSEQDRGQKREVSRAGKSSTRREQKITRKDRQAESDRVSVGELL